MSTLAEKLRNKVQVCSTKSDVKSEKMLNTCDHPRAASVSIKKEDRCNSKAFTQPKLTDVFPVKKKRDRFNGKTEEEVLAMLLPDHLDFDLDIIIIGINPGLTAAHVGHHYAGPGNHFWKCLHLSGLTSEQMNAFDDYKMKSIGIGFTNIVSRTSRGSADLSKTEIKEGAELLIAKIQQYRPKIAVFNGKGIYEVFCGHKNFFFGKQPLPFPGTDTVIFVMPSSSARCSQLPRAIDKAPFYVALRKLRDHISGLLPQLDESEVVFPDLELKVEPKREQDGGVANRESQPCDKTANKRSRHAKHCHVTKTVRTKSKAKSKVLSVDEKIELAKQVRLDSVSSGSIAPVWHSTEQAFRQSFGVIPVNCTAPLSSAGNAGMFSNFDSSATQLGSVIYGGMIAPPAGEFNAVKSEIPYDISLYGYANYQGCSAHSPP